MAVVIPYVKQTHTVAGTWTAAKANVVEDGVNDAHYQPAVRVYHSTTQSHTTSGSYQAVTFNSERIDQAGNAASTMHDTSTNPTRLTCRYAGVYMIGGCVAFASNATGIRALKIRHQGTTDIVVASVVSAAVDNNGGLDVSTMYPLAVNEYVELLALQNSGGALNISSVPNAQPEFWMVRVA